jgi:hypothetical protein
MLSCDVIYVAVYCTQPTLGEARLCELHYIIRSVLYTRTLVFRGRATDARGFVGDLTGLPKAHFFTEESDKIVLMIFSCVFYFTPNFYAQSALSLFFIHITKNIFFLP